jgi:hypothetical protein
MGVGKGGCGFESGVAWGLYFACLRAFRLYV